jgi:hypothetical protein
MRILGVGMFILGLGVLFVFALLAMIRELFSESIFGAPSVTGGDAVRKHTSQSPFASFSA